MAKKKEEYGNESIKSLKGADRVRKRPAVIFGSDGVEGCAHSIFEIVSNSIDEARDGHGNKINVTLYPDHSVEVEDFGRGIPVDYNKAEERWNWDLVFCELYAGGKYGEGSGNYDFSLGLNGLGLCATQYSSEWMTADIYRDGMHYHLDFKKGENVGGLKKEPFTGRRTGSVIRWKPDTDVFTDINVPADTFKDMLRRQAVVNDGVTLVFNDRTGERAEKIEYFKKMHPELAITWHFIGHLQSNKTRPVAEHFDWVQTVDRLKIAQRLSEQRPADMPPLNVLIEVHISDEESKSGCQPADVPALAQAITLLPNLKLRGIMAIPAPSDNEEGKKAPLKEMHAIFLHLRDELNFDIDTLSMGMSADMAEAVECGSTMVRVGSAIFGPRDYTKKE